MEMSEDTLARKRRLRSGGLSIAVTIAVTVACVASYVLLEGHPFRYDFTQERDFSLSDQTKAVLKELSDEVKITAFFRKGEDLDGVFARRRVDDLLREYASRSPQIVYQMVDPDAKAELAVQYRVADDGTAVFQSGSRRKEIYKSQLFDYRDTPENALPKFVGEGLFTNAILKVSRSEQTTLCLLQGHGERDPEDLSPSGIRQFREYLTKNNYEVKTTSLMTGGKIPPECRLLILASSARMAAAPAAEDRAIRDWVLKGGRILLLLEPGSGEILPETMKVLHVAAGADLVLDPERHFVLGPHFPAPVLSEHPITRGLQTANPILSTARSLIPAENQEEVSIETLLSTSPKAWGETDLSGAEPRFDKGQDTKGPLTLGIAVGKQDGEEPVAIVVGDADFLSNGLIQAPGNLDLSLNMVGWLVGDKDQVTIRPKSERFRNLTLTEGRARFIAAFTQFIYPLLVLLVGGLYWYRRRNR